MVAAEREKLVDGKIMNDRSCTDSCMILLFFFFLIGWLIIFGVAYNNGKPERILYPENFRGDLCNDGELSEYPVGYWPKPNRWGYVMCARKCPAMLDYVCNNDIEPDLDFPDDRTKDKMNTYYDHTFAEASAGPSAVAVCRYTNNLTGSCTQEMLVAARRFLGLQQKLSEYKCFMNFYASAPTLYRCIPFGEDRQNASLANQANETLGAVTALADQLTVGTFFRRGFAEIELCWVPILITVFTAMLISCIWIFLLRWILAPVIYLCLFLVLVLFAVVGYLAMLQADDLESVKLPGEEGTNSQVQMWRAIQYTAWVCGAIYIVVMIYLISRVRIAIQIMKMGSKAFLDNPSMVIIPPIVLILLIAFFVLWLVSAIYIHTIGSFDQTTFRDGANTIFGETLVNATINAGGTAANYTGDLLASRNITNGTTFNSSSVEVNTTQYDTDDVIKALHAYNFFGFLWACNICIMFGFFIMALTTCCWYFSATTEDILNHNEGKEEGRQKSTPYGTVPMSFLIAIRYHLGTIMFGALLIAIVQFIRALVLYFQREVLEKFKDSNLIKMVMYCINCCLACIERVIKIISKNAFIITCIKNTSFIPSAIDATRLLVSNALRTGTLMTLTTATIFIVKLFIIACNMVVGWFMIQEPSLTQDEKIESGLFPMIIMFFLSYIIASLFLNVYESCVDTIMMCFFVDEEDLGGHFMNPTLRKMVGQFEDVGKAREEYNKALRNAEKMKVTSDDKVTRENMNEKPPKEGSDKPPQNE